ncbi:hypothetical protein ZHAS_00006713 [Anopheles sinensis]|uniref:Uncharacterized protein n=1 Tax=Anopheles sinensis TaxID=74873 RepID=A0A084VM11_ANOSI|nr:hypothetical protein ZHAS_00006713 [Anopheles sinensis]
MTRNPTPSQSVVRPPPGYFTNVSLQEVDVRTSPFVPCSSTTPQEAQQLTRNDVTPRCAASSAGSKNSGAKRFTQFSRNRFASRKQLTTKERTGWTGNGPLMMYHGMYQKQNVSLTGGTTEYLVHTRPLLVEDDRRRRKITVPSHHERLEKRKKDCAPHRNGDLLLFLGATEAKILRSDPFRQGEPPWARTSVDFRRPMHRYDNRSSARFSKV